MKSSSRKRLTVAAAAAQTSIRRAASSSPGSRMGAGRRVATATAPRGTPRLRREKRPARTPPPRRGGGPRFLPAPITHAGKAATRPPREEQIGNAWGALQELAARSPPCGRVRDPRAGSALAAASLGRGRDVGRRETLSPVPGSSDTLGAAWGARRWSASEGWRGRPLQSRPQSRPRLPFSSTPRGSQRGWGSMKRYLP